MNACLFPMENYTVMHAKKNYHQKGVVVNHIKSSNHQEEIPDLKQKITRHTCINSS